MESPRSHDSTPKAGRGASADGLPPHPARGSLASLGLVLLFVLGVLAGGYWFYRVQEQHLRKSAGNGLQAIARLKEGQIEAWRAERIRDAVALMKSPFFIEGVNRWMADRRIEAAGPLLARLRILREQFLYHDVLVADAKGHVRLSLSGSLDPLHPATIGDLAAAFRDRKPVLTDLHAGPGDLPPHLDVIAPLFAEDGQAPHPVGAIILQADAQQFLFPLIQSWPTPSATAETLLVRKEGQSVLFLNELRHRRNTALKLQVPLTRRDMSAVMAVQGVRGIIEGKDYRGVEVLAALMPIPGSPWFIVAKVDAAEIFSTLRFRNRLIGALLVSLLAMAAAVAGLVWQRRQRAYYRELFHLESERRLGVERYRTTLLSVGDGVIATDARGRVDIMNPVAEALTGWPQEEAFGRPLEEVFRILDEESRHAVESPIRRVMREGKVVGLANHTLLVARNGTKRPIADSGAPICDESGAITGVVLVFQDQTAERAAQKALGETLAELSVIHQNAPMAMMLVDRERRVVKSNVAAASFAGRSAEEMAGLPGGEAWRCLHHLDDPKGCGFGPSCASCPVRLAVLDTCATGVNHRDIEGWLSFPRGNGSEEKCLLISTSYLRVDHTERVLLCVQDITDRKRIEEALRASEARFSTVFRFSPIGICLTRFTSGEFVEANEALLHMMGYSREEIVGRTVFELDMWPDSAGRSSIVQALSNERGAYNVEVQFKRKSGELRDALASLELIVLGGERYVLSLVNDVTDRRRAEDALRAGEERYRMLFDEARDGIAMADADTGVLLDCNQALADLVGRNREELIGQHQSILHPPLNQGENFSPSFERHWADSDGQVLEEPLMTRTGEIKVAEIKSSLVSLQGKRVMQGIFRDVTERKRAEEALRESEERIRSIFNATVESVILLDTDCTVLAINEEGARRRQRIPNEMVGRSLCEALPSEIANNRQEKILEIVENKTSVSFEEERDGQYYQIRMHPVFDEHGEVLHITSLSLNITASKRAEEERGNLQAQLLQATKMEAVGRLAGGVAHDFNNMLNVILGYTETAMLELNPEDTVYKDLEEIMKAVTRSSNLTHQLLAFSRRQAIAPTVIDMNAQMKDLDRFLRRIIGEDVDLEFRLPPDLWPVFLDPTQLDQIVANLAVNARDAMPDGGRLLVETRNTVLSEEYCRDHLEFRPGDYVLLEVSDSGCGMDKQTLEHVFEPFFTTKGEGRGTGLGMATVYGIISQNNGFINLYSEPGQGTVVRIYLPRAIDKESVEPGSVQVTSLGGRETVLLAEDEASLRKLVRSMLEGLGYSVLEAVTPDDAIAQCGNYAGEIHLLVTDVVMPAMNGRDLETRIKALKPDIKTLFMSGYTADLIAHRGILYKDVHFLQKPFSREALAAKVREVLDEI